LKLYHRRNGEGTIKRYRDILHLKKNCLAFLIEKFHLEEIEGNPYIKYRSVSVSTIDMA
jgi:hypothetical protein